MTGQLDALRKWRSNKKLRIGEIARQMNYARPYVSNIFRGASIISDGFIGRFYLVYGAEDTEAIFGEMKSEPLPEVAA